MDYQTLLIKYLRFVQECEGIDFTDRRSEADVKFTDYEWAELEYLSRRATKDRLDDGPANNVKHLGMTENGTKYTP